MSSDWCRRKATLNAITTRANAHLLANLQWTKGNEEIMHKYPHKQSGGCINWKCGISFNCKSTAGAAIQCAGGRRWLALWLLVTGERFDEWWEDTLLLLASRYGWIAVKLASESDHKNHLNVKVGKEFHLCLHSFWFALSWVLQVAL